MGGQQKRNYRRHKAKAKKYRRKINKICIKVQLSEKKGKEYKSMGHYDYCNYYIDHDKTKHNSEKNRSKQRRYDRDIKHSHCENDSSNINKFVLH